MVWPAHYFSTPLHPNPQRILLTGQTSASSNWSIPSLHVCNRKEEKKKPNGALAFFFTMLSRPYASYTGNESQLLFCDDGLDHVERNGVDLIRPYWTAWNWTLSFGLNAQWTGLYWNEVSVIEVEWTGLARLEWSERCLDWSVSYKSKWERYCWNKKYVKSGKHCKIIIFWVRNHRTCQKNCIRIFCQTLYWNIAKLGWSTCDKSKSSFQSNLRE